MPGPSVALTQSAGPRGGAWGWGGGGAWGWGGATATAKVRSTSSAPALPRGVADPGSPRVNAAVPEPQPPRILPACCGRNRSGSWCTYRSEEPKCAEHEKQFPSVRPALLGTQNAAAYPVRTPSAPSDLVNRRHTVLLPGRKYMHLKFTSSSCLQPSCPLTVRPPPGHSRSKLARGCPQPKDLTSLREFQPPVVFLLGT